MIHICVRFDLGLQEASQGRRVGLLMVNLSFTNAEK